MLKTFLWCFCCKIIIRMTEGEISNELFKLERAMIETKREYNNLLSAK